MPRDSAWQGRPTPWARFTLDRIPTNWKTCALWCWGSWTDTSQGFSSGFLLSSTFRRFNPTTSPVGSAVYSGVPETPPSASVQLAYLGDQLGSFLFSQSQWLLRSAMLDISLMAWLRTCPLIPKSFINLTVDVATKPRHPTSTGQTFALYPLCSASAARSEYRSFFLSKASSTASSHGTVSSTKYTLHFVLDHKSRSGLRLVMAISGGTVRRWPTSTSICQSLAASNSPNLAFGGNFCCPCCPSRTNATKLMINRPVLAEQKSCRNGQLQILGHSE